LQPGNDTVAAKKRFSAKATAAPTPYSPYVVEMIRGNQRDVAKF
jgi:hypothetical protein